MSLRRRVPARRVMAVGMLVLGVAVTALPAHATGGGGTADNGFSTPVQMPDSYAANEPSLVIGRDGRIYVSSIQYTLATGNSTTNVLVGSPVWRSGDSGSSFQGPARALGTRLPGRDTDLALDAHGNVYLADLWIGNIAMAVSGDGGQNFVGNEVSLTHAGADRPWLAYSPHDNILYDYYNGLEALHVAHTAPLVTPAQGLVFPVDVPAVTECPAGVTCTTPGLDTHCTCPPGGIATDPRTGEVYITYASENGVVVASSTDEGLTWTHVVIPGSAELGTGWADTYTFQPIRVDSAGNVYVAWAEAQNGSVDSNGNVVAGGVAIRFSRSTDHGATWSAPLTVSTTTGTNVYPALAVGSRGTVHIGFYGTVETNDPGLVSSSASWDVIVATSTDATDETPAFTTAAAVHGVHSGCLGTLISVGCGTGTNGSGLGDFFSMATSPDGTLGIAYTAGGVKEVPIVDVVEPTPFGPFSVTQDTFIPDTNIYYTQRH